MILIHGGAWDIPSEEHSSHLSGLDNARTLALRMLQEKISAEEIVVRIVSLLESHEAFDAGVGSVLNQDGEVEMDAGFMSGETGAFGAVIGVQAIEHPIQVAKELAAFDRGQTRIMTREGAEKWWESRGNSLVDKSAFVIEREVKRLDQWRSKDGVEIHISDSFGGTNTPTGTVGCVAIDHLGRLAAATSTGGAPFTLAGRVGDSALPGSGYYANLDSAVSCTGWGEAIAGSVLAARIAEASTEKMRDENFGSEILLDMERRYSGDHFRATAGYIALRKEPVFAVPSLSISMA